MSGTMEDSLLLVGRVVKTQGIKGQVRVSSFGEGTATFCLGRKVYLENTQRVMKSYTIEYSRPHGHLTLLGLQGVKRIEDAEELVGCSVYVPKESLEALPEDEFYWYQLIGLQVKTEGGTFLGTVKRIFPTGSNDVFVVRKDAREVMIPATDEVVAQVDLKRGFMVIRPLEGLLAEDDL